MGKGVGFALAGLAGCCWSFFELQITAPTDRVKFWFVRYRNVFFFSASIGYYSSSLVRSLDFSLFRSVWRTWNCSPVKDRYGRHVLTNLNILILNILYGLQTLD